MLTLRSTPDNPVPPGGALKTVRTEDGVELRAAHWRPTTRLVKGTVCLLQGRAEFIEKYYETIGDLRGRGFAVVAFDWRGQGESQRQVDDPHRGHVARFDDYRRDLKAIEAAILDPLMPHPHLCLAHFHGGRRGAHRSLGRLAALPPHRHRGADAVDSHGALARRGGLPRQAPPGPGAGATLHPVRLGRLDRHEALSEQPPLRDPKRYARNAAAARDVGAGAVGDPASPGSRGRSGRCGASPTHGCRGGSRCRPSSWRRGADPVCGTPAAERFARGLRSGHILVLPDARHEILSERDGIRRISGRPSTPSCRARTRPSARANDGSRL